MGDTASIFKGHNKVPQASDYVIIGAGPAGLSAANVIKQLKPDASVTIIGDENLHGIQRTSFSKLAESLDAGLSVPKGCILVIESVVKVEETNDLYQVTLSSGQNISCRKGLLLALGVHPDTSRLPNISDAIKSKCLTLRSLNDYRKLQEQLKTSQSVAIYGDGYVACELSSAIKKLYSDTKVTILNPKDTLLTNVVPEYLSKYVVKLLKKSGVEVKKFTPARVSESPQTGSVKLTSAEGKEQTYDLVIFDPPSTASSSLQLLRNNGTVSDLSKGVPCDQNLQHAPKIFTAGDVANVKGFGHIEHYGNAKYSGQIAGHNMVSPHSKKVYNPIDIPFEGNIAGIKMIGVGRLDNNLSTIGLWESREQHETNDEYKCGAVIYYDDDSSRVRGVLLVNLPNEKIVLAKELLDKQLPTEMSKVSSNLLSR